MKFGLVAEIGIELLIKFCLIFTLMVVLGLVGEEVERYKRLLAIIGVFAVAWMDVSSLAFLLITVIVLKTIWKKIMERKK